MLQKKAVQRTGTPEAEFEIDSGLIRKLLSDQHPDLANLPISLLGSGWDNVMFRLGQEFCARLPRRGLSAKLIEHEQKWLPRIAERVPLPVPAPVRTGHPTEYYPWHWSVVPWFDGQSAEERPLEKTQARVLGEFLRALHTEAPSDFPKNPYRGVPLQQRAEAMWERFERLSSLLEQEGESLRARWERALSVPMDTAPLILHGDLHPQNVVARAGLISGIIDWGDLCGGDVATDLASAWMLFRETSQIEDFFAAYGPVSENTLVRAEGWAIAFGVMLLDTGLVSNRRHEVLGREILKNLNRNSLSNL